MDSVRKLLPLKNQRGQSLVESLVAVIIVTIAIGAFMTLTHPQQTETKALSEKLASADLQELIGVSLADGTVCNYLVSNPAPLTFDSTTVSVTNQKTVTPTLPLYASVQAGPPVET